MCRLHRSAQFAAILTFRPRLKTRAGGGGDMLSSVVSTSRERLREPRGMWDADVTISSDAPRRGADLRQAYVLGPANVPSSSSSEVNPPSSSSTYPPSSESSSSMSTGKGVGMLSQMEIGDGERIILSPLLEQLGLRDTGRGQPGVGLAIAN